MTEHAHNRPVSDLASCRSSLIATKTTPASENYWDLMFEHCNKVCPSTCSLIISITRWQACLNPKTHGPKTLVLGVIHYRTATHLTGGPILVTTIPCCPLPVKLLHSGASCVSDWLHNSCLPLKLLIAFPKAVSHRPTASQFTL